MKLIGKWQGLEEIRGASVLKLALSVGNITSGAAGMVYAMPPKLYFDDNLFFEVHEDEKKKKFIPRDESQVALHQGKFDVEQGHYPMVNRTNGDRSNGDSHHSLNSRH